jgi:hypothetical protein
MATDFLLAGYQAIKTLLLADASLATPTTTSGVRKFVWFDTNDPQPEPERRLGAKQAGDFAELKLDWLSQTDTFRTATPTMGNQGTDTCPFVASETHEFVVTVTVDDVRISRMSSILNDVKRILRNPAKITVATGIVARLGQSRVRNEITDQGEAAGRRRRVATITIPVTIAYQGAAQRT